MMADAEAAVVGAEVAVASPSPLSVSISDLQVLLND